MTGDERLDNLRGIVDTLAASVVAHDNQIEGPSGQIEGLIEVAMIHNNQIEALVQATENHGR